jgi:endoglucanase
MMRIHVAAVPACALLLTLAGSGCKKRVAVTGDEVRSSAEGRACPKSIGLISDGENNSNQIADIENRGGYWYTFVDEAGSSVVPEAGKNGGTFQMTPGGANGSKLAAHMTGTVGTGAKVFVGMGFNFVDPKGQYDASRYQGISFWAKKGPGSADKAKLKVPDVATDPDGKVCQDCFNDFGLDLTLSDEWTQYTIPFTAMKQDKTWGSPHPDGIDPSRLYGLQFQFNQAGAAFDMWLDEVEFTGCGN